MDWMSMFSGSPCPFGRDTCPSGCCFALPWRGRTFLILGKPSLCKPSRPHQETRSPRLFRFVGSLTTDDGSSAKPFPTQIPAEACAWRKMESAALLHEAGAEVEILVRAPFVRWLWRQKWFHTFKPVARLLYAPPDVGQAGLSHLVAKPNLFRRLPRSIQDRWGKRAIRPAGA